MSNESSIASPHRESDLWSFRRVWFLLRNMVVSQYGGALIAIGIISGIYAFSYVLQVAFDSSKGISPEYFFIGTVIPTGLIVASMIFTGMHKGDRGIAVFMLPASTTEKFVAGWFVSSVGTVLVALVVFGLTDVIVGAVCQLIFGERHAPFDLFGSTLWSAVAHFLVWQPLFLFGSIRFRRLAMLKTVGWMMLVLFVLSLLTALIGWIVFQPYVGPVPAHWYPMFGPGDFPMENFFMTSNVFAVLSKILYFAVLPLFFIVAGFLRLRETELHHGVR